MIQLTALLLVTCFTASIAWTAVFSNSELQRELDQFKDNPKEFYKALPPKKGPFSQNIEINIEQKLKARSKITGGLAPWLNLSEPRRNDQVQNLVESNSLISNIRELQDLNLSKGEIAAKPWSDDYWPYYRGALGSRYADVNFPSSHDWKVNFDYYLAHPFFPIFENGSTPNINSLSPAEKYDLIIGSIKGALTKSMWIEGENYYKATGKVESWMGLCHGWAPASYMQKRPERAVEVLAFDGKTSIKFFPSDIKALSTLLWASARTPVRFVGGRCNSENPEVDSLGRPTDPNCLDNNPATWHLALTNRVGVAKKSFIMDSTYDYEVWNQPIISYSYTYFNPKTLDLSPDIESARVSVDDFADDKFKSFRSAKTSFIIGIKMQTTYLVENPPRHRETDGPENDSQATASYTYDLELDDTGNIIGGEWYRNAHPDFLWTPTKDARAAAKNDYYLLGEPLWNGKKALPKSWQENAHESAKDGQPLLKIIESLTNLGIEN